jgi:hypothetical protein
MLYIPAKPGVLQLGAKKKTVLTPHRLKRRASDRSTMQLWLTNMERCAGLNADLQRARLIDRPETYNQLAMHLLRTATLTREGSCTMLMGLIMHNCIHISNHETSIFALFYGRL